MKLLIIILLYLAFVSEISGQKLVYTAEGKKVILYDNFTWRYANDLASDTDIKPGISKIEICPDGLIRINLSIKNHRIHFFDGKVFLPGEKSFDLEYHQNSFFSGSLGKIKEIEFDNTEVTFEYHQNTIFPASLGKIKQISYGNETIDFEYYTNDFYKSTLGKLKEISKGMNSIKLEYHDNSIFPETAGKLKSINGTIPEIEVVYFDNETNN